MQTKLLKSLLLPIGVWLWVLLPGVLQFQQSQYTLIFERLELVQYDHDYIKSAQIHNFKYNRTCTAVNATFDVQRDMSLTKELIAEVQAYKLYSNEYRFYPIRFMFDLCQSIGTNEFGLHRSLECGNFTGCPFKKVYVSFLNQGLVTSCNFFPDGHRFPPLIPSGSYKLDLKLFYDSQEILFVQGYGTIKYPSCKGCPLE